MSDAKQLGEAPAFPANISLGDILSGLTKRELFAAMVASGGTIPGPSSRPHPDGGPSPEQAYAREALRCADALLEELTK